MNRLFVCGMFLLVLTVSEVQSNAAGPPINGINHDIVCNQFRVWHDTTYLMAGNGGYVITTNIPRYSSEGYNFTAGQTYTVNLTGTRNTFRGFMLKAFSVYTNDLLGQFIPQNCLQRTFICVTLANDEAYVGHSNYGHIDFQNVTLTWRAPSSADGFVDFAYVVIQVYDTYYLAQTAARNDPSPEATTSPPLGQTTTVTTSESMPMGPGGNILTATMDAKTNVKTDLVTDSASHTITTPMLSNNLATDTTVIAALATAIIVLLAVIIIASIIVALFKVKKRKVVPQHDYEYIDTLQLMRHSTKGQHQMESNNVFISRNTSVSSEDSAEPRSSDTTVLTAGDTENQPITDSINPAYGTDIGIAPEIEIIDKDNAAYHSLIQSTIV